MAAMNLSVIAGDSIAIRRYKAAQLAHAHILGRPVVQPSSRAACSCSRWRSQQRCIAAASPATEVSVPSGTDGATRKVTTDQSGPVPTVRIDNENDAFSTIVCISYGDRLGELLDTVAALKNLGLNVRRAKVGVNEETGNFRHKFYITDSATSEKILRSRRLEEIRLTILNNLLLYHPESAEELNWGMSARKADATGATPLGARSHRMVETIIDVDGDEDDQNSTLFIKTLDRPGLLVEIVKVLKDINVNVISAEVNTEGKQVIDTFYITYHGEPLNGSMVQLVTNALQYYLSLNEVESEESY